MEYAYLTDPGKVRDHNEDSVIISKNKMGEILLAVADGMGGHCGGEIASSIAISHIDKRFSAISSVGEKEDAISFIKEMVSEANVLLYKYTSEHKESSGMGTTIVLAILTPQFLLFGNIGDSSGYVLKKGKLHKVTTDRTLVSLLVLMRALGATNTVEMDIIDVERDVDGILLCSDGLTNMLDDEQIAKVLTDEDITIDERLKKLVVKCNNRGGTDNISIAYLKDGVSK